MKLKEAQQYLNIPRTCIYELVRQGSFPACKVNHKWYIERKRLQGWLGAEIGRKDLMEHGTKKS